METILRGRKQPRKYTTVKFVVLCSLFFPQHSRYIRGILPAELHVKRRTALDVQHSPSGSFRPARNAVCSIASEETFATEAGAWRDLPVLPRLPCLLWRSG